MKTLAVAAGLALTVVALGALAGAGGHDDPAQARIQARQAAVDPPQLWLAEALDHEGRRSQAVFVCADKPLREGLLRASAVINGEPCFLRRDAVEKPGLYAVRCEVGGRRFGLTASSQGDTARDFTVSFALHALDGSGGAARQVRRYRLAGACPAGWRIGDQARPGATPAGNALGVVFESPAT